MEPTVLILGLDRLSLPLDAGPTTADGRQITRLELSYTLDPLEKAGHEIRTSLQIETRYCESSGAVYAREWVDLPILFQRRGEEWICKTGQRWCWSTDWPH